MILICSSKSQLEILVDWLLPQLLLGGSTLWHGASHSTHKCGLISGENPLLDWVLTSWHWMFLDTHLMPFSIRVCFSWSISKMNILLDFLMDRILWSWMMFSSQFMHRFWRLLQFSSALFMRWVRKIYEIFKVSRFHWIKDSIGLKISL